MQEIIKKDIQSSIDLKNKILESPILLSEIEESALEILSAFKSKNKLLLAGNGGSAADAQHISAEFVNRFNFDRPGLPAISLTTDTSVLTSVANDCGFEKLFVRQISAFGNKGDVFVAISTSGNSKNLIEALKMSRDLRIRTIGLTGSDGGIMKDLCDICIKVPSVETPRIQEVHILIGHIICSLVEEKLFGKLNH